MGRSTEQGHHNASVFMDQDQNLQASSGAGIYQHNGSSQVLESGARVRDENIGLSTADATTSISNYGVTYLKSTRAKTWSMVAPTAIGVDKTIIAASTFVLHVRSAARLNTSAVADDVMMFNNPSTITPNTSGYKPNIVTLRSLTTGAWVVTSMPGSTADFRLRPTT